MADLRRNDNHLQWAFLLTGLGALGALGAAWLPLLLRSPPPPPVSPAFWVCDRDGDRVLGLDPDLFVSETSPVTCPIDLLTTPGGGVWVLRGDRSMAGGRESLVRLDARGEVELEVPVPGAETIVATGGSRVLLIAGPEGQRSLLQVDREGRASVRAEVADGARITAGPAGLLLAEGDSLRLLKGEGPPVPLGGGVVALSPAIDGWWVLERGELEVRLLRLDPGLRCRVRRRVAELRLPERGRLHLGARPDRAGAWIVHEGGEAVRVDSNAVVRARGSSPMPGAESCLATGDGGVLIVLPGAIARLDADGRPRPGQGGFAYLSSIGEP